MSETERVTGFVVLTVGVVCVLVGGIWTLQGLGVIGGSFMTNSPTWLVIGLVITVAGLAMIILGTRGRRKKV
jgi:hypothetical protein